jgi:hypothetical protein
MTSKEILKNTGIAVAAGAALGAVGYAGLVAYNRASYGRVKLSAITPEDSLIARFIPTPEVVERHQIAIDAPPDVVLAAATDMELLDSPLIRAIFRLRELALGGEPDTRPHPTRLLPQMQSIGWVVLAERTGREIVLGSVTQPWQAAPVFRSIPPADFKDFAEPGYVKIAWTLRAEPQGDRHTLFQTETRVCTTDTESRARFRRYWSYVAPGVELIRLAMFRPLKAQVEKKMAPRAA